MFVAYSLLRWKRADRKSERLVLEDVLQKSLEQTENEGLRDLLHHVIDNMRFAQGIKVNDWRPGFE